MLTLCGSFSIKSTIEVVVVYLLRGIFIIFEKKLYIFVRKLDTFLLSLPITITMFRSIFYAWHLTKHCNIGERITEEKCFQTQKYLNMHKNKLACLLGSQINYMFTIS